MRCAHDPTQMINAAMISLWALHSSVGLAFCIRIAPQREGTLRQQLLAVPSFITCYAVAALTRRPDEWPVHSQVITVLGVVFTLYALLSLGRSFSILPALRKIRFIGPYRWVRHPMYLGETLMLLGFFSSQPSTLSSLCLLLFILSLMLRINAEEELLSSTVEYRNLRSKVPYRLMPGLWWRSSEDVDFKFVVWQKLRAPWARL